MIISKKMDELICKRCGHKWIPRVKEVLMCPKCKSYKWNENKINGGKRK